MSIKNICILIGLIAFFSSTIVHNTVVPSVITLFSHGIADNWKQVRPYIPFYKSKGIMYFNNRYTINTPFVSFNYPDATTKFYRVNYNETSFGQANELSRLYSAYIKTLKRFDKPDIILYGISRGASNVAIFAGLYSLLNVRAIILESPFFTMGDVIQNIFFQKNLNWIPLFYGEALAELIFKKYTHSGNSPEKCIDNMDVNIPILIICSLQDSLVPYTSSLNLYKKLLKIGHKNAYIFIADHGKHAAILQGADGEKYKWVVNAFYKKYNLPYSAVDAEKGESLLSFCQPIIE